MALIYKRSSTTRSARSLTTKSPWWISTLEIKRMKGRLQCQGFKCWRKLVGFHRMCFQMFWALRGMVAIFKAPPLHWNDQLSVDIVSEFLGWHLPLQVKVWNFFDYGRFETNPDEVALMTWGNKTFCSLLLKLLGSLDELTQFKGDYN